MFRFRPPCVPTGPCQLNLGGAEGYIEAPPPSGPAFSSTSDCSYTITVSTGYGVEVQVGPKLLFRGGRGFRRGTAND